MKCNHPKESLACEFHYNGICTRDHNYECPALVKPIENIPTADVVKVKRGSWVHNGVCSECGKTKPLLCVIRGNEVIYQYDGEMNYCPNCGADMRGERRCRDTLTLTS